MSFCHRNGKKRNPFGGIGMGKRCFLLVCALVSCCWTLRAFSDEPESIWLEAEHFVGIRGYCWPLGDDSRGMRITDGNWGLSGPGWAAEWNQGGESGFMSIATSPAETNAVVTQSIEIPRAGDYQIWVRYADWREQAEEFEIRDLQEGRVPQVFALWREGRRRRRQRDEVVLELGVCLGSCRCEFDPGTCHH